MISYVIAFLIGDLYLQTFAHLPSILLIALMILVCLMLARFTYLPIVFALGFAWTAWYASSLLSWTLPKEVEGKPITITGYVASLPSIDEWQTHFLFKIDKALIRLSWRNPHLQMKVGDEWQLHVKLKRIHSTQNPGAFDYEAWALQKGLRATGYVVAGTDNKVLSHFWYRYPIDQFRQKIQERIREHSHHLKTAPWLMALIIGEREGASHDDWQILRNTGTNHLMAIAGLHIGMIAGFAHLIFAWLWRRVPRLLLIFPAHLAGACFALMTAILYSALAGFSIPTQRACIMLSVFICALLLRRQINKWQAWSLAMLIVLLLNPLSVLTDSFWLSFGTIGLIIYGMSGRFNPIGVWWKHGRVQWVIGIGLIPLSLVLFQQCALISFIANSIAIPWLGFLVLPFCLLSAIVILLAPALGGYLLVLADKSLSILWLVLAWFSHWHFSTWQQVMPNVGILILTFVGFLLLLLPAGFPGRWLGIIWIMPLFFYKPVVPRLGDVCMTLLDVGQGLSVVVQTTNHVLVYDAGPKYNDHFDMGESVVLPYLYTIGSKKIDMLVISHGDNDHIGGAQTLLSSLSVQSIKTSVPNMLPSPVTRACMAGDTWEWDQVRFTFLHPKIHESNLGNDSSCVLRINVGNQRILLTGDIEKRAENELLFQAQATTLASDILIAPHHGSKTSGMKAFITAVHPHYVLYAIGYRNRYHFPHPSVVDSYAEIGTIQLNTAESGAISFKLEQGRPVSDPQLYRVNHIRYWFG